MSNGKESYTILISQSMAKKPTKTRPLCSFHSVSGASGLIYLKQKEKKCNNAECGLASLQDLGYNRCSFINKSVVKFFYPLSSEMPREIYSKQPLGNHQRLRKM